MKTKLNSIKQKFMDKYCLDNEQANKNLVFCEFKDKIYVGLSLCDSGLQDQNFYFYDAEKVDDFCTPPIAQIKFMTDNKPAMFIRRLEFVDFSYKGKGYASKFMQSFEAYCINNNFNHIFGELIPLHNESEQKVENYYIKNGFKIVKDENGQKIIHKDIKQSLSKFVDGICFIADKKEELSM